MAQLTMLFLPVQKNVEILGHETVLSVALSAEVPISHSCGGMGSCGTCRIFVEGGIPAHERTDVELEMAEARGFQENERLACQLTPSAGLRVRLPSQRM